MSKFIVTKEPLAVWFQPGEEVEITDEQTIRNLLRDGRINVPQEPAPSPTLFPAPEENADTLPPA